MAVITELVTKFSFQGSLKPLEKFNKGIQQVGSSLGRFGIATAAAATGAYFWASSIFKGQMGVIRLSKETGLSVEKISALRVAMIKSGGEASQMESTLGSLSQKISNASLAGDDDFSRMGITVRKNNGDLKTSEEMLFEIGRRLRDNNSLGRQQKLSLASRFGIDATTFNMITQSDEAIKKLMVTSEKEKLLTTKKAKVIEAYNARVALMSERWEKLKTDLAIALMPTLEKLANLLIEFVKEHLPSVIKFIGKMSDKISSLVNWFNGLSSETQNLIGILAGLAILSTFVNPITLLGGAIVALTQGFIDIKSPAGIAIAILGGLAAVSLLATPIGLLALSIGAIVAGFIAIGKLSDKVMGKPDPKKPQTEQEKKTSASLRDLWLDDEDQANLARADSMSKASAKMIADKTQKPTLTLPQTTPKLQTPPIKAPEPQGAKVLPFASQSIKDVKTNATTAPTRSVESSKSKDGKNITTTVNQNVQIGISASDAKGASVAVNDGLKTQLKDAFMQIAKGSL
jgi:hypothetical protein